MAPKASIRHALVSIGIHSAVSGAAEDLGAKMEAAFRRGAGVSGVVFFVLMLLSFIFGPGDPPGFNDSAETVASFAGDNRGEIQAAMALTIAAGPFLLLFLAGLVRTLRQHEERGPAMLASVAFAGGILIAAFAVLGRGLARAASYHPGDLDPGVVRALWDASLIGFIAAVGIGFTALIGASSAVALVHGPLPRVLGAAGAALAFVVGIVATFAETGVFAASDGELGVIAFLAFLVWIVLVSAYLLAGTSDESGSTSWS